VVFILGESWINQLVVEQWRGRLVALYGSSYALSQLAGPLVLGFLGSDDDFGFWAATGCCWLRRCCCWAAAARRAPRRAA
jgi:MFS family permease